MNIELLLSNILISDLFFFVLSGIIIFSAIMVVTCKNLIHAAINLILSLFSTAGLFVLMNAEFVAIAQVMVYIGGVVVFMLFTILLTTRLGEEHLEPLFKNKFFNGTILVMAAFWISSFIPGIVDSKRDAVFSQNASIKEVAIRFLDIKENGFIVPFEVISVLILVAMIGAITIAISDKQADKNEDVNR